MTLDSTKHLLIYLVEKPALELSLGAGGHRDGHCVLTSSEEHVGVQRRHARSVYRVSCLERLNDLKSRRVHDFGRHVLGCSDEKSLVFVKLHAINAVVVKFRNSLDFLTSSRIILYEQARVKAGNDVLVSAAPVDVRRLVQVIYVDLQLGRVGRSGIREGALKGHCTDGERE